MDIVDRVQVVPLGYETVRVMEPIHELRADKVVLIRQDSRHDHEAQYQRDLVTDLEENNRIELESRECNFFDFESSLRVLTGAIRSHSDHDVYVNVSTGSKITAIAAMVACQNLNATPFYVRPEFRNEEGELEPPEDPLVTEIGDISDIPIFRLEGPSTDQLEILSHLAETEGATKKELIQFSKSQNLDFISGSESKSDEGLYRLLETHIIDPLESESFVSVEKAGRTKRVYLDERGEDALQVFQPDS